MTLHYLLHAAAFVIALCYGFLAAGKDEKLTVETALRRSKALVIFVGCLLAVAAVTLTSVFYDPLSKNLPLPIQRYSSWITWGILSILAGVVSGYTLSLAVARKHGQWRLLVFATILINLATALSSFRFLAPIHPHLGAASVSDGIVLQTENSTCAAATLANIAGSFGDTLTEKQAAEMLMTARLGTELGPIRYALSELGYGFETIVPTKNSSLSEVTAPAFLFIDLPGVGNEAHAVAYMGETQKGFEIWDPTQGRIYWDEAAMRKYWHGNGIMCSPPR